MQDGFAKFTPHFMLRKCSYDADTPECTTNCIHKGRYCAVDSISDDFNGKFKGWQVRALLCWSSETPHIPDVISNVQ